MKHSLKTEAATESACDPDAQPLREEIVRLREQLNMYISIFDSIHYGSMVTDPNGIITHFNKPYGRFLGLDPEKQIGRHCTEVVENSRMHIVAKTGKAEFTCSHRIKGQNMVVHRVPIMENGQLKAVFGLVLFKDVRDVGSLAKKLSLLESKVKLYEEELLNLRSTRYTFDNFMGVSRIVTDLKKEALRAASSRSPVLITGESGTGKEILAQAIHHASGRKLYPFVRINCASIPKELLESELFGYEKGAFTGARSEGKPGKFELAHRGTMFLDEIGDMPLAMQPKLLRILEEKEFERVGGNAMIRSDFRVIAATNQNLEKKIESNEFRKDLFYRLNVIVLNIPPLRDRQEDIMPVAQYLLTKMADEMDLTDIVFDPQAVRSLRGYDWPGNVRELSNVLERTLSRIEGRTVRQEDLPFFISGIQQQKASDVRTTMKKLQEKTEKDTILSCLKECGYNKTEAAKMLGIHRTLLYRKIRKHGILLQDG
jgi:PAS domain S-box-containing protein